MRYALIAVLLLFAGCAPAAAVTGAQESADVKAIREWDRDRIGDGIKASITNVRKSGTSKDFLVDDDGEWVPCPTEGRCVIATMNYPDSPLSAKADILFVMKNGKVADKFGTFKRRN